VEMSIKPTTAVAIFRPVPKGHGLMRKVATKRIRIIVADPTELSVSPWDDDTKNII
jgi:hypothetical protein